MSKRGIERKFFMKRQWNIVLLILLILLIVIFSVMNVDPVNINFGFNTVAIPLVVVIIATLLIGVLIAVILSTSVILKNKSEQKKLNQKIADIENKHQTEKEQLVGQHKNEINTLTDQKEKDAVKIRELERRIQNMETTRSVHGRSPADFE